MQESRLVLDYMPNLDETFPLTILRSNIHSRLSNRTQQEAGNGLINDTSPCVPTTHCLQRYRDYGSEDCQVIVLATKKG